MNRVLKIHDEIFKFLYEYMKNNKGFAFMPRAINKQGRLDSGYWFPGDEENYLSINFFKGGDDFNKTGNITFGMHFKEIKSRRANTCCIQLSNTPDSSGYSEKKPVIKSILDQLVGFEVDCLDKKGSERRWNRYYSTLSHIDSIKKFVTEDKPIIDNIIQANIGCGIEFLDINDAQRKIERICNIRQGGC